MILPKWEELPDFMRTEEVRPYYDILNKKKFVLFMKRLIELVLSLILLIVLLPILLGVALLIKLEDGESVMFRQERVTTFGKTFRIFKFRTMEVQAEKMGPSITSDNDSRVTRIGSFLRDYRLDELPQLINILKGEMSFVGCRPEVPKYVKQYSNEMLATLLLPAGVTSDCSIEFKDEADLLKGVTDVDKEYVEVILPQKMAINLRSLREFSFVHELRTIFRTVLEVFLRT